MMDINLDLFRWFINFLIKTILIVLLHVPINLLLKVKFLIKQQLAGEFHKPIIRKLEIRKLQSSFIDNIWSDDLADMQLIDRYNKGFQFKLYVIDIFSKYAWVIPLKDKKCIAITNGFQKMLDESNCKPTKVLLDNGSEFYNRPVKSWLQDNDIEMYSTHNEGKYVVAERFIRTLEKDICKLQMYDFNMKKRVY